MKCKNCIHHKICCNESRDDEAMTYCADFFELVRCKDCKHYGRNWCHNEEMPICGDDATLFEPDEDFWCKYGERKKQNG